MTDFTDHYWQGAADAALAALDEADLVLVPQEFLSLSDHFAPLEFSWGVPLDGRKVAFCICKDDPDRLADPLLDATTKGQYRWANEVFVLGANFAWRSNPKHGLKAHLGAWLNCVQSHRNGVPVRRSRLRRSVVSLGRPGQQPKVLVVGASGMGNVGDDLLADVLAETLFDAGAAEVWLSGPDVDPLDLRTFDALVVGGGGLIYAARGAQREWQNLANYLKFGPVCHAKGVPVALIGVGDQDHGHGIDAHPLVATFTRYCLPLFCSVSTRDAASTELLARYGAARPRTGPDLLFTWADRAAQAPRPMRVGPRRIALAGELYDNEGFRSWLTQDPSALHESLQYCDFDFLVMSEDDVAHGQRLREAFRAAGGGLSLVDLRGHALESLVYQFAGLQGLVTTRFHGLVLALLTRLPLLALDGPQGKSARLLAELGATAALASTEEAPSATAARISRAVEGEWPARDDAPVDALSEHSQLHRDAIDELLAPLLQRYGAAAVTTRGNLHTAILSRPAAAVAGPPDAERDHNTRAGLLAGGEVGLCFAASTRETQGYANLGDALSAVVVCALSGQPVRHVNFGENRCKLVAVGSIAHAVHGGEAVLWGSGVSARGGILPRNVPLTRYDVRALRGPISAGHLRGLGVSAPEVYGDPVWLLPSIFHEPIEKKYELGVIPHIQDIEGHGPQALPPADSLRYRIDSAIADSVTLINTWHEPTWDGMKATLRRILECKRIVSQSFHGVVIAEAYRIPVLNFRQMTSLRNGPARIPLGEPCTTDPRIFEFYQGGPRDHFWMYAQRRDQRSDWGAVMRAVDAHWEPFEYDPAPLLQAFPLPLAYDPLRSQIPTDRHLAALKF